MKNKNTQTEEVVGKEEELIAFGRVTKMRRSSQGLTEEVPKAETQDKTPGCALRNAEQTSQKDAAAGVFAATLVSAVLLFRKEPQKRLKLKQMHLDIG